MQIPNPELAKVMRSDAKAFASIVKRANNYAKDLEGLEALIASPKEYIESMLPNAAKELELSFLKLVDLYDLPFTQVMQLAGELKEAEYLPFIIEDKEGLKLDDKAIEEYISKTAVIEVTGYKERIYKQAQKLSKDLNLLREDLKKDGVNIQLANIIRSDYAGNWQPNKPFILTLA